MGRLSAYNTKTMQPVWSFQQRSPFLTAVLSTGGGRGVCRRLRPRLQSGGCQDGKILWQTQLGTTVQGYPVSFSIDGKQYIAVTTGWAAAVRRTCPMSS